MNNYDIWLFVKCTVFSVVLCVSVFLGLAWWVNACSDHVSVIVNNKLIFDGKLNCVEIKYLGDKSKVTTFKMPFCIFSDRVYFSKNVQMIYLGVLKNKNLGE